jgi:formate hydrogenlyase subunit 6/NADH:ubiquinone oxidoreductase subunit I
VGGYFGAPSEEIVPAQAVVMARACDIAALALLDRIFLDGDFPDPFYRAARSGALLVSMDCTEPAENCFCTFVDGAPFARNGHDLNLSCADGGYVVTAGSDAGAALLEKHGGGLTGASPEALREVERARGEALKAVQHNVAEAGLATAAALQDRVRASSDAPLWNTLAEKCVECAACNLVCPTCHCFLLVDAASGAGFRRFRNWDGCLYASFAREASGANPRGRRAQRLHGRIEKKFDFLRTNLGAWGCVGCGRCIDACAGKIDVRETLRELLNAESL